MGSSPFSGTRFDVRTLRRGGRVADRARLPAPLSQRGEASPRPLAGAGKALWFMWMLSLRRGGGVADRARLESVCTSKGYRGFESLPLRHFLVSMFCATSPHGGGYWMCKTGSDFEPSERKIFVAGATAEKSCGRIGMNGASGSATNENDPFCGGFSGFGQAERAAEPPRGTGIGGGKSPEPKGGLSSEALAKEEAACGAPRPDPRSPQPVLAARDLATPPLAGGHWRKYYLLND